MNTTNSNSLLCVQQKETDRIIPDISFHEQKHNPKIEIQRKELAEWSRGTENVHRSTFFHIPVRKFAETPLKWELFAFLDLCLQFQKPRATALHLYNVKASF